MNTLMFSPSSALYEPYPGCSMSDFMNDFLNNKPMTLQAFCMKERIDPHDLPRLVQEILVDWELTEPRHSSRQDATAHLINHLRIKIRNEQRNNNTRGYPGRSGQGRGQSASLEGIAAEIYRLNHA